LFGEQAPGASEQNVICNNLRTMVTRLAIFRLFGDFFTFSIFLKYRSSSNSWAFFRGKVSLLISPKMGWGTF
jgi:hypothetical protein